MHKGLVKSYITGYVLSLLLTFAAFIPVFMHQTSHHHSFTHAFLLPFVIVLALVQLIVQLVFFLHLGREEKPYFNAIFLMITVGMVLLVVVGSIWIMYHLNTNMMPAIMDQQIIKDEGYHQ